MRILVTGGAGFIGSHVVDSLVDDGHDVLVVDALLPLAHEAAPDYLHPAAVYLCANLSDAASIRRAVIGVDAVVHHASMVGLGRGFADVTAYVRENDLATATLLEALHERDFRGPFVLASSMVVYGEGSYRCPRHGAIHPAPRSERALRAGEFEPSCPHCSCPVEPEAITEDAPLDPRNVYAATKLHQEHLTGAFAREHPSVTLSVLRYHNVYGPRMPADTPYAGVASLFRSALEAGMAPRVFEDGNQLRDFVHVHDVARANLQALHRVPGDPLVCNVASGAPSTVGNFARLLCASYGDTLQPGFTGEWRLGDVRHVIGDITRARDELDFEPAIALSTGIAEFATAGLRAPRGTARAFFEGDPA